MRLPRHRETIDPDAPTRPTAPTGLRVSSGDAARVTGQLEHPNIVPVYDVGCRDDDRLRSPPSG